jgi:hypothetical protein
MTKVATPTPTMRLMIAPMFCFISMGLSPFAPLFSELQFLELSGNTFVAWHEALQKKGKRKRL